MRWCAVTNVNYATNPMGKTKILAQNVLSTNIEKASIRNPFC